MPNSLAQPNCIIIYRSYLKLPPEQYVKGVVGHISIFRNLAVVLRYGDGMCSINGGFQRFWVTASHITHEEAVDILNYHISRFNE